MTKTAKIGFIGAGGFISAHHLATARDSAIMSIHAIADLNQDRLAKHAAKMPVGYTTTNYKKLLNDPEIDIIIIGTKQDLHAKLIIESLEAGKWVLCEKPMANTLDESLQVLEVEANNPGRLTIGFNRRFAPAYRLTKKLISRARSPWFINYRMMNQSSHVFDNFYKNEPRMLYEGCHILDLARWLLNDDPVEVFMTGDRLKNNCCILSFADGSQFQFMCGSIGATSFYKENMEIFGQDKTIAINDFIDMRIRGFENECDRLFEPYRGEHGAEVMKYGFDFYEMYMAYYRDEYVAPEFKVDWAKLGVANVMPKRPTHLPFDIKKFHREDMELNGFVPNKGWYESLEHFAQCFLSGSVPDNAAGIDGAKSTELAMTLLESLKLGKPVDFRKKCKKLAQKDEYLQVAM